MAEDQKKDMSAKEEQTHSDFVMEQIKDRPIDKKKLLQKTMTTAGMAVMFGLIACITFLFLEPIISGYLYPQEPVQIVTFPEETQDEEMDPEEMLTNEDVVEQENDEEVQGQNSSFLTIEDVSNYYHTIGNYVEELNKSMVTVTGIRSDLDWFEESYERSNQTSGVLVANNGREYLILTKASIFEQAESIQVTFCDERSYGASIKAKDTQIDLMVIAVSQSVVKMETAQKIVVANLATSNLRSLKGVPVIALGSPMGSSGSMNYGMITSSGETVYMRDANYKLLVTDMTGASDANGFLFNLQGGLMGIIGVGNGAKDRGQLITALGISELKKIIEKLSNDSPIVCFGIDGMDVPENVNMAERVPLGIFVSNVYMNSPAMEAGIWQGDIIVSIREEEGKEPFILHGMTEFSTWIQKRKPEDTVYVGLKRLNKGEYEEMEVEVTLRDVRD